MSTPAQVTISIPEGESNEWGICSGVYNAVQSRNGDVERYIHSTNSNCQIIRLFTTEVEYKWHLAKLIPQASLPAWFQDSGNSSNKVTLLQKVPLWYNVEGKGGEDIPCYSCADDLRIEAGVITHRYNVKYSFEDPDYSAEYGGKPLGGSSYLNRWLCKDGCNLIQEVQDCTWSAGDKYHEERGCDGGVNPLRTRLFGWVDSGNEGSSLSEIWEFTNDTDASGAQDHTFFKSGCFFEDGDYPNENVEGDITVGQGDFTNPELLGDYFEAPNKYGFANNRTVYWRFTIQSSPEKKWTPVGAFYPSSDQASQLIEAINWVDDGEEGTEPPSLRKYLPCMLFMETSHFEVKLTVDSTKDGTVPNFPIGTATGSGTLPNPPSLRLIGPEYVQVTRTDTKQTWDDPGASEDVTPSKTVDTSHPGTHFISYTYCDENTGLCTTVYRTVHVTEEETPSSLNLIGSENVTLQCNETWSDPGVEAFDVDGTTALQATVTGEVDNTTNGTYEIEYCVTDSVGVRQCVKRSVTVEGCTSDGGGGGDDGGDGGGGTTAPTLGPANLSAEIPTPPNVGPANLSAEIPTPPNVGPANLAAGIALPPSGGPQYLKTEILETPMIPKAGPSNLTPATTSETSSAKFKGYVFDPRTSSISGPFISQDITALTTKDNSSEMYAVNRDNEIIRTVVTDLNDTSYEPAADPFTDLTTPLSGKGIIMSASGKGYAYRNRYKSDPFSESIIGSGPVENPLYFKDAYLSIAETNWLHLGDEHNEKQVHRVDLRFHKNSIGHVFLYVKNDAGMVKGQYKGPIKEHMKVFTNLRGRGFQICMMIAAHKDYPWAMREMAIGHLYGKSF